MYYDLKENENHMRKLLIDFARKLGLLWQMTLEISTLPQQAEILNAFFIETSLYIITLVKVKLSFLVARYHIIVSSLY